MRCGYEVVAYLNVIINGSDFIAFKEQMATPGGSDTSLYLLAWQCGPSGNGCFCSQDSQHKPGCSHAGMFQAIPVCCGDFSGQCPSWSAMGDLRPSLGAGVQGWGTGRVQE